MRSENETYRVPNGLTELAVGYWGRNFFTVAKGNLISSTVLNWSSTGAKVSRPRREEGGWSVRLDGGGIGWSGDVPRSGALVEASVALLLCPLVRCDGRSSARLLLAR